MNIFKNYCLWTHDSYGYHHGTPSCSTRLFPSQQQLSNCSSEKERTSQSRDEKRKTPWDSCKEGKWSKLDWESTHCVSHLLGSLVALMFRCKNDSFVADCMHRFWPCRCHQAVGWLDLAQKYQERNRNRTWMNLISDLIKKCRKCLFTSPRHVARPNSLAAWRSRSGIATLERIKTIL